MIQLIRNKPITPAAFCFWIGLLVTLPLILLTPPFQVPDEPQHFYRAFQISEFNLMARLESEKAGGILPSSLIELSTLYLNTRAIHASRTIVKRPLASLSDGFDVPLDRNRREFIDFSGTASYSPLPYVPQSLAFAIGTWFGAGPLALLYMGRLVNAVTAVILLSYAVRVTPVAKTAFMVVGLLPMSVYMYASLSLDGLVIGSAFLFTAIVLRAYLRQEWRRSHFMIATGCAAIFCSVKVVYAPLLLIALPSALYGENRIRSLIVQLFIVCIPLALTAGWLHAVSELVVPVKAGTSVEMQLQYVLTHPLLFLEATARTFLWNGFYFVGTIGNLGWLNLKLPLASYVLPLIAILFASFSLPENNSGIRYQVRLWWGFLAASCSVLVMLALYLYWTVVASPVVAGVQGRYFIPFIPLLCVAFIGAMPAFTRRLPAAEATFCIAAIILTEAALTFYSVSRAFWML